MLYIDYSRPSADSAMATTNRPVVRNE